MKKHIQQYEIKAYKGISDLVLEDLNYINILTGDNNSGKTSVLELLSTLKDPGSITTWFSCTRVSGTWRRSNSFLNGFYNLFPVDNDQKEISYNFLDAEGLQQKVSLKATLDRTQVSTRELNQLNGIRTYSDNKKDADIIRDMDCMYLSVSINGKEVIEDIIYEEQSRIRRNRDKKDQFVRTMYVSPVDHATGMYDISEIFASRVYDEMIRVVQKFDEDIVRINAVRDAKSPFIIDYKVVTKNHEDSLPLSVYGDGMKKAIYLLNGVVKTTNGILLIDEFETGIHTSAMDSVFSVLLQNALKYNTQLFLTSHSKEAIDKVLRCDKQLQQYVNLYTLYKHKGKSYARKLSCEEAIHAQENLGLELR